MFIEVYKVKEVTPWTLKSESQLVYVRKCAGAHLLLGAQIFYCSNRLKISMEIKTLLDIFKDSPYHEVLNE